MAKKSDIKHALNVIYINLNETFQFTIGLRYRQIKDVRWQAVRSQTQTP